MALCGIWKWACVSLLIASFEPLDCASGGSILIFEVRGGGGGEEKLEDGWKGECPSPESSVNYWPVIGILSHPRDGASGRLRNSTNSSYIAASYVKFVQAAGARVIPLVFNEPAEILHQKLKHVNGILFTGGWAKDGLYLDTAKLIFQKTLEINDAGEHFPLFGICLGFEILSMVISRNNNIFERFKGENQASTLAFIEYSTLEGTIFQRFPTPLIEKLSRECLVMQNHKFGISPRKFGENPHLSRFFRILTTSEDSEGKGNRYPVTGFPWHPEKNAFEWGQAAIPHSEDAIQVTQQTANNLIREARKSTNRPPAEQVLNNLIYNFSPTYCGKAGKGYDEVYIFS